MQMIRDQHKLFPLAVNYHNIRAELKTGDVAIFGGKYRLSKIIGFVTGSPVSHVATIIREGDRISFVEASEGDMYPEREGVIVSHFSNSIPFYKGNIWIARLDEDVRKQADIERLKASVLEQVGKPYDYADMPKAGLDLLDRIGITRSQENGTKLFCSELVGVGLKSAGILPESVNVSELSPADIIKYRIFNPTYYQIKAYSYKAVKLPGFNTIPPQGQARAAA